MGVLTILTVLVAFVVQKFWFSFFGDGGGHQLKLQLERKDMFGAMQQLEIEGHVP